MGRRVAFGAEIIECKNWSTRSFFKDRSITFGSLIGISRSGRMVETSANYNKRNHKLKFCFFSLCSKLTTDAVSSNRTTSLGHYLEAERRAAHTYRTNHL
ncbi:unnamed protein product [Lupinus luteus]|uniref:Uncharacterized protein n=1 Tax=Lupinus luteus TaxID=3873 RepID=A0AAV1Y949_LUPLU